MAITVSSTQAPIQTSSTPQLQQWSFSPNKINIDYYQGGAIPESVTVQCIFKDVIGTAAAEGYGNFTYKTYLTGGDSLPAVLVMSGDLFTGQNSTASYTNGISGNMLYNFQNLQLLDPGIYTFTGRHYIYGQNIVTGLRTVLAYFDLPISIRVFSNQVPVIIPTVINFQWILGTIEPQLVGTLNVTGSAWSIKCPIGFIFTCDNPDVDISSGDFATGSGTATVLLLMFPAAEPDPVVQNPATYYLEVNGGVLDIPVIITYVLESGLFLEKEALHFTALKSITEAEPQSVALYYPNNFKLKLPPWLVASATTGTGNATITFSPISANNLEVGTYTGTVVIIDIDTNEALGTISITYLVSRALMSPYPAGQNAFTLDPVFLQFVSAAPGAYFTVALKAKIYDFYSDSFTERSLNFKAPLFQGRQSLNIGQPIDRLMARMSNLAENNTTAYRPAEISMVVTEVTGTQKTVHNVGPIKFIAGLAPSLVGQSGFLDINAGARRVTPSSYQIVNMMITGIPVVKVYRNSIDVATLSLMPGIRSYTLDFAALGAVPGDVFEVNISEAGSSNSVSKLFKVFPEGYNSNLIVWENEYKLRSLLECTGKYKISSEVTNRTQELELQLRAVLEKIDTTKVSKLTLSTGWLLQSDMASVESLMRSKRAILIMDNNNVELVPTSKDITNVDDDRALISFDLEFQINRAYNEEIYSF